MAAPTIWNQLPITIKSFETIAAFRKQTENIHKSFSTITISAVPCLLVPIEDYAKINLFVAPVTLTCLSIQGYRGIEITTRISISSSTMIIYCGARRRAAR